MSSTTDEAILLECITISGGRCTFNVVLSVVMSGLEAIITRNELDFEQILEVNMKKLEKRYG